MDNVIERRNVEYIPLIEDFKDKIKGLNLQGLTGPHFPCVGECYEKARYKFAFCGMETYGWTSLQDFMETKYAQDYLQDMGDSNLNNYNPVGWITNNLHTTFWGFIFKFLAKFYNYTDVSQLINEERDETSNSILKSMVWCNSNSIERFVVSSKPDADPKVWKIIKEASIIFDDLNHIINFGHPDVIFVFGKDTNEKYLANDDTLSHIYSINEKQRKNVLKIEHKNHQYRYYYLRNSATHVFLLPHPRWIGQFSGIGHEKYIESLLKDIKNYNIWDVLPETNLDWKIEMKENNIDSIDYKYQLIASIAHTLIKNNFVMYGGDLGKLFNVNNLTKNNGDPYFENGNHLLIFIVNFP